jgi:hypothetical protein
VTQTAVVAAVTGATKSIIAALNELVAERRVRLAKGERNANIYTAQHDSFSTPEKDSEGVAGEHPESVLLDPPYKGVEEGLELGSFSAGEEQAHNGDSDANEAAVLAECEELVGEGQARWIE